MTNDTLIHQLKQSNDTLHEKVAQLSAQKEELLVLCYDILEGVRGHLGKDPGSVLFGPPDSLVERLKSALAMR